MKTKISTIVRKGLIALLGTAVTFLGSLALVSVLTGKEFKGKAVPTSELIPGFTPAFAKIFVCALAVWIAAALLYIVSVLVCRLFASYDQADE